MRNYRDISYKTRLTRIDKCIALNVDAIPDKTGYYLAGFADGEGSFVVTINRYPRRTKTFGLEIRPSFTVGQHKSRSKVLSLFKDTLGCGKIRPHITSRYRDNLCFEVEKQGDLLKSVIPFFDKFQLQSQKKEEYITFRKVLYMLHDGEDFTLEGTTKIVKLRSKMNSGKSPNRKDDAMILGSVLGRRETA